MLDRKTKKGSSGFKSARASKLVARRWGMGVGVGVKSVHNLDLEAERNKNARHTGRLEVENTAAKLNERSQSAEDDSWN